jgi:hypothetical protein
MECHAIGDLGIGGVATRLLDRRLVEVDAVDARVRIGAGDGDRRPALATRDVRDARPGRGRARACTSGIWPSQSAIKWWNCGRLPAAWPSRKSSP